MSDDPLPGGADSGLFISPVVVVTHTFPARPGALPDAELFVREALEPVELEPVESRALYNAITSALLAAAGPAEGVFDVTVRLFPDGVEVEVLHGAASRGLGTATRVGEEPFADWLTAVLRRQGLSQQAAAQRIGVSVRTVSRWLSGVTEPRLRDLRRVHAIFGSPPGD
ncbi:helix-turn-helix transcriptional regulator [Streptomyces sp. SID13031]|uniref:helix-turn-helix domain-containing protein n=1 Tax=Streptomyces sp. SID13031 TaxID=2706046 RepID=UPI0013CA2E54|nr:helix-turn-helix transcriptional regulator [Streptomyces sp. SID13031]NEA36507.1 helix-turn-helix transcriptional regulator [Streptomyces sp. SID13031]